MANLFNPFCGGLTARVGVIGGIGIYLSAAALAVIASGQAVPLQVVAGLPVTYAFLDLIGYVNETRVHSGRRRRRGRVVLAIFAVLLAVCILFLLVSPLLPTL